MRGAAGEREQRVLEALIKLYIEGGEPVSSRMLEECAGLGIKSASIRSVLGELERKGLLAQPHSSSGRTPTDDGYRAYVNSLLPPAMSEELARQIHQSLHRAGEDLTTILGATARLLGRFSSNIAIVAGPRDRSAESKITGVELYDRDGGRVLLVVSLDSGAVRTELIELGRALRPGLLIAASALLAERLCGRTLDATRRELDHLLSRGEDEASAVATDVASSARGIFSPEQILHITFEGVPEALRQPEFADPERLKALLGVIARHEDFERAFEEFVTGSAGEVSLAIGRENPLAALHSFTLMATRYEVAGASGYLGVLGPRRMRYARTLALLHGLAEQLERLR